MQADRLPFVLTDWTRLIWTSERARAVWQPRINNMNEAWARMERWAVVDGARNSALTFFEPSYLPEATKWATSHGCVLLPMAQVGLNDQYSASPKAVVAGEAWQYRAVLTRPEYIAAWYDAWQDTGQGGRYAGTNNRTIGELLGFPDCCIDFFEKWWVGQNHVDVTLPAAMNTPGLVEDVAANAVKVSGPPESNVLLRWLGVRLVPHLPCSFACSGTVDMAKRFVDVGRKRQFGEWIDYMYEMLEWPIEWSALHGIAEVRTPVVTISTRTNATAQKVVVQRDGAHYPEEGAQGLKFPYRIVKGRVTEKPAYQRLPTVSTREPTWKANGFSTQAAMDLAHSVLLNALPLAEGSLLDLGAGTGAFLEKAQRKGWRVQGIESVVTRAAAATVPVLCGDLFDVEQWPQEKFDVIAFMPGRLLEKGADTEAAQRVREKLQQSGMVLFYAYGDWLAADEGRGLRALTFRAGFDGRWVTRWHTEWAGAEAMLCQFIPAEDTQSEHIREEGGSAVTIDVHADAGSERRTRAVPHLQTAGGSEGAVGAARD